MLSEITSWGWMPRSGTEITWTGPRPVMLAPNTGATEALIRNCLLVGARKDRQMAMPLLSIRNGQNGGDSVRKRLPARVAAEPDGQQCI